MKVTIWVDGSAWQGRGGWGVVLVAGRHRKELSGSIEGGATNQRMEILAAIQGLRALKPELVSDIDAMVISDSAYVVNCFRQQWFVKWRTNGWTRKPKGRQRTPIANRDLWEELLTLDEYWTPRWRHVKGHSGVEENERADELAADARRALA